MVRAILIAAKISSDIQTVCFQGITLRTRGQDCLHSTMVNQKAYRNFGRKVV